jgi:hypothetical protein
MCAELCSCVIQCILLFFISAKYSLNALMPFFLKNVLLWLQSKRRKLVKKIMHFKVSSLKSTLSFVLEVLLLASVALKVSLLSKDKILMTAIQLFCMGNWTCAPLCMVGTVQYCNVTHFVFRIILEASKIATDLWELFAKFIDCNSLFFKVPPLASYALLTTLHPLLENMLQTVDHFEISCLGAPLSWLEKPRNCMGWDLNWILCLAWKKWIGGTPLECPPYNPDLAPHDFWAFPTMKRELQGKKFRSD